MEVWQRSTDSKNWKQLNMNAKGNLKDTTGETDKGQGEEKPQGTK